MSAKRKQESSLSQEERAKIRRLSSIGNPVEQLAQVWEVDAEEVERILAEDDQESGLRDGDEVVKRLMKDPEELCCPLSCELMEDPVVAADGFTYERSWVEEQFRRAPGKSPMTGSPISTAVLHPIQEKKALVISFKEETVKEILSVVPRLANHQALELLKRGEHFLRPLLPDSSASKKLASLLLLRLKLPGTDHGDIAKEALSLLTAFQDEALLQEAFLDMNHSDLLALLPSLDEESLSKLHRAMLSCSAPNKGLVAREQARRLASRLNEDRLRSLWRLIQASLDSDDGGAWMQAAACVLSAHLSRLQDDLSDVSLELLLEAAQFLRDQDAAIAFAKGFFDYDLGISSSEQWPQRSTASICHELAHRLANEESEEKLQMLLMGHGIDESHAGIQDSLAKQLQHQILCQETGDGLEQEGLFLKLALKEGHDLPVDVILKLRVEERHLGQASADQLMVLSEQLDRHDRHADGCQVALFAAKAFKSMGEVRLSEEAFLRAFNLDHLNKEAAQGVAGAVASAHTRCKELEEQCQQLKVHCNELEERCVKLERRPQLDVTSPGSALLSIGSSLVWDLSGYDFTGFKKNQGQFSDKFQLPGGINAWMELCPKGHSDSIEGKAAVFFKVDKAAVVKWTMQSGGSEPQTLERDFSKASVNADGTPQGYGWPNFMPISETKGRITLGILSVRAPGSTLSFS